MSFLNLWHEARANVLRRRYEDLRLRIDAADPDANIIFGTVTDERLQNEMKITVIATGFEKAQAAENLHNFPVRQNIAVPTPRQIGNPT